MTPCVLRCQPREEIRAMVLLFHGYGGDAASFFPFAQLLAQENPHVLFLVPDGKDPHEGGMGGRQWFSLVGFHDDHENFMKGLFHALTTATEWVKALVEKTLEELASQGVSRDIPVMVGGFSQGGALALHCGLYGFPTQGVMVFSGFYKNNQSQAPHYTPPVFWAHGMEDNVVPLALMEESLTYLRSWKVGVEAWEIPGLDHRLNNLMAQKATLWMGHFHQGRGS